MKKVINPLLDKFLEIHSSNTDFISRFSKRQDLVKKYSFAIPDEFALQKLVEYSPIVEIGAGLGYWANLVNKMGGKVLCYDDNSWELNKLHKTYSEINPIQKLNKDDFFVSSLFLCWPPMEEMSETYLKMYMENGGQTVIYVGEGYGGCTANDEFFEIIENNFKPILRHRIPQWEGIHDEFCIFTRA